MVSSSSSGRRSDWNHWSELWAALGARGDARPWHERIVAAYSGPARYYHNLQHLEACLHEFDAVRSLARQPAVVELAFWFHDAVYDPRSSRNEEDSAELAASCLTEAGLAAEIIDSARQLILATKTHQPGTNSDAALVVDVDLAILGQPADCFGVYDARIRAEYRWVPEPEFRAKRRAVLADFLARPRIYTTTPFRVRYEAIARANLSEAIRRLTPDARG